MILEIKSSEEFDLSIFNIDQIWVEIDESGKPKREIGFRCGNVVHMFPGRGKYGDYGIFDVNVFDPGGSSSSSVNFEEVWNSHRALR